MYLVADDPEGQLVAGLQTEASPHLNGNRNLSFARHRCREFVHGFLLTFMPRAYFSTPILPSAHQSNADPTPWTVRPFLTHAAAGGTDRTGNDWDVPRARSCS